MITILDGKRASEHVAESLRKSAVRVGVKNKLAIVNVGDNKSSSVYIARKIAFGEKIGIRTEVFDFSARASAGEIKKKISEINKDSRFAGIIVQLPLPEHLSEKEIIDAVAPEKDVDGLTSANQKALVEGRTAFVPATARGVFELLSFYKIPVSGKKCAVVGQSDLAGKPIAWLLRRRGGEVEVFDEKHPIGEGALADKDIVVSAVGKPHLIRGGHIKKGATVIDVGINFLGGNGKQKMVGDADFEEIRKTAGAITPVPGGVGPMTVLALFENLLDATAGKMGESALRPFSGQKQS